MDSRTSPPPRRRAPATVIIGLVLLAAGPTLTAAQPSYTLDTDPIRIANRAFEQGNLDEARTRYAEAVGAGYRVGEARFGLAQVALSQGRLDDAESEYRLAIAAGGARTATAQAGLGLLLLRLERTHEAPPLLEQALAADPGLWPAHYGMARLALLGGDLAVAERHLEQGRRRRGMVEQEDLYQHGRALLLLARDDLAGAETAALRAMHLNPADATHARLVAHIYERRGVPALAIQAYEQALAGASALARAPMLHQLGNLYLGQQRFNEAHDAYVKAVAADSSYAPALRSLASLLKRAGRHEAAASTYLRYVRDAESDTLAWLGLAESLLAVRRFDQARQAADHARALDPTSGAAVLAFARASLQGTDPAAKAEAVAALAAAPDSVAVDAALLVSAAAWQADEQQYEAARATLARAAAIDSTRYQIPFQQGVVALRLGDLDAAVAAFERAIALEPASAALHLNLGIARYQGGNYAAAIPSLREAVARDPDLTVAHLMLGQALAVTGALPEAEDAYRQVLAGRPDHPQALRGLGFCRLRQADYDGAATYYHQAAGAEPGNADGWAGLGNARLGQGRLDDAATAFDRARAIDPRNAMLQSGVKLLEQARQHQKENGTR